MGELHLHSQGEALAAGVRALVCTLQSSGLHRSGKGQLLFKKSNSRLIRQANSISNPLSGGRVKRKGSNER